MSTDPEPSEEAPDETPAPHRQARRYPSTLGGAFYLLVLLAAGVGLAVTAAGDWRVGVRILAGALAAAAGARLVLPSAEAGMLAVRHRLIDVGLLATVAAVIWALSTSIPNQPGG